LYGISSRLKLAAPPSAKSFARGAGFRIILHVEDVKKSTNYHQAPTPPPQTLAHMRSHRCESSAHRVSICMLQYQSQCNSPTKRTFLFASCPLCNQQRKANACYGKSTRSCNVFLECEIGQCQGHQRVGAQVQVKKGLMRVYLWTYRREILININSVC
jgi:hypothetical protein